MNVLHQPPTDSMTRHRVVRSLRPIGWLGFALLCACSTLRLPMHPAGWSERLGDLQHSDRWDMHGRAAVVIGSRGWQASVDWQQRRRSTVVHLAGPLGIGATVLRLDRDGLSVNGSAPSPSGVDAMQERFGFELPVAQLRYWLLGVPDPDSQAAVRFNTDGRASQLIQAGWTVDFLRYRESRGDWLPGLLVLNGEGVRVRIVIDRWGGV